MVSCQNASETAASSDLCSAASRHSECVARPGLVSLPGDLPGFRPLPWARPLEVPIASSSPGCKGHAAQHKQLGNLASVPGVPQLLLGDYLHQRLRGQLASQIEECSTIFICRLCLGPLTFLGTHRTSTTAGSCRKTQTGTLYQPTYSLLSTVSMIHCPGRDLKLARAVSG